LLFPVHMQPMTLESPDFKHSELQEAFLAFGSVSQQLSGNFDALRAQVVQLREQLGLAQESRANLGARLAALLTALPGGVLVLDAAGCIQECNPAARSLLGEPLLDLAFASVLERGRADRSLRADQVELHSGRIVNISRRDLDGGGHVVLITDVTESQAMQVMLARQQRLLTLGELAAGLAHQIRTPLAAALLYSSQMTLSGRAAGDLVRCADKTVESLKQLDRLVNDMLAFAHGGATRELVSVSALLEQVAQWLRPALRTGVRLTIRTAAPDLAVRANAPSLVSAVLNLATNALQAAGEALDLELLARRSAQGRAEIVVSDNGPGVPPSLRERIFEPYFTTRERGHGIGLAIVRSVVEAHAGSIRLAPSDCGATFIIDLPEASA
jgi:two-component system sensor histidine kinase FlrB